MKKLYSLVMTALALLVTQNVFAADPDLSGYTAIKTMDFSKATYASDVFITTSTTQCGTAFETGNKLYQKIYEVATPEELQGYLALQAAYDGSKKSKGWWLRSTKGGLYSFNASRSGAVINLKKDYVVAFNCTQDAEKVMSLINDKGEPDGSFTYEKSEDTKTYYATMTADGQVNFCGNKSAGYISSIVVYAPGTVVVQPTAAYTAVNGTSRTVTFTGANLAYNTDGSDTYTNFKDGEGNNVNKAEVTVSETTTYYVVSTNGEQKSDVLQFTIEAGTELSLANPVASITKMGEGFARTYSVVCNNKDVLLTPTAKLTYDFTPSGEGEAESGVECNGTIEATAAGTYVVTASAEGYTSTSVTIDNTKEYELTKAIDFTTLKTEDLSANWKKKAEGVSLPGSSSQWPAKYGDVVADKYFYDFSAESASATDVLAGLNVEINKDGKAPVLFTGFGMMYPIYQMNAEGEDNTENKVAITDGKLSIADGTAEQVGVYTYINNYGKNGTKTTIVAGDKEFALYRFSDMLTKVEIYSPKADETPTFTEINNLAELRAIKFASEWDEVPVKLNLHDAKITALHKNSDYGMEMIDFAILEDATGAIDISNLMMEATAEGTLEGDFAEGSVLNGTLYATLNWPNSLWASEDTEKSQITLTTSTVVPTEATLAEVMKPENDLRLFKLQDVTIKNVGTEETPDFDICQGEASIELRDAFAKWASDGSNMPEKLQSVTGILYAGYESLDQETPKYFFTPLSYEETPAVPEIPVVENIAGLRQVEGGEMEDPSVKLMLKNAKITYVQKMDEGIDPRAAVSYAILEDETGAVEISNIITKANANNWFEAELKEGVELNGYINVNYSAWSTALVVNDETSKSELTVTPTTIVPTEAKIADLQKAENHLRLFELKDVDFAVEDGAPVIKQDDASIILADQFAVLPEDMPETAKFESVVGVVFVDFETYVFCPISYKFATSDGISSIAVAAKNAAVYNLNGAKVRNIGESVKGLAKGIYVVGGKKIVVK